MVRERLRDWQQVNGFWPNNMLFYRDGVSESQIARCQHKKIGTIKQTFKNLTGQDLSLTYVICGKRHHTRFYATDDNDSYRETVKFEDNTFVNGYLKPDLLVTQGVTNPSYHKFFLQSHKAIKGTARSAHYHVLEDGMNIGIENFPKLTMMLCCAFSRATSGVSYVAPAYIADRLCELGRIYLREWNLDSEMRPKLDLDSKKIKDAKRLTQKQIDQAKKEFSQTVAAMTQLLGTTHGVKMEGGWIWENPWQPLMNKRHGMFWM